MKAKVVDYGLKNPAHRLIKYLQEEWKNSNICMYSFMKTWHRTRSVGVSLRYGSCNPHNEYHQEIGSSQDTLHHKNFKDRENDK